MELHKAPALHPSASPCSAQGRGAAGDGTKQLQASQLQLPSWHGKPEPGTQGRREHPKSISCPELKHSSHAPVIPTYLPAGRWVLLVEFFLSCHQAHRACAKLLQKIRALGQWDSKGKQGCGGEDKHRDKRAGRRKTSGDVPFLALKSQQRGRAHEWAGTKQEKAQNPHQRK